MLIKRNYNHNNLIPVLMQQDNKCPLCGSKYSLNLENMELAHIYPMSRYPTLAADTRNIIPICKKCNRKMHNKKFDEYCMENNVPIPERVYKYIKQKENILSFIENNRRT